MLHNALENVCATVGCTNTVKSGSKSCVRPVCQRMEQEKIARNSAMFQLRERYHRQTRSGPSTSAGVEQEIIEMPEDELAGEALIEPGVDMDVIWEEAEFDVEALWDEAEEVGKFGEVDLGQPAGDDQGNEAIPHDEGTSHKTPHVRRIKATFGRKRTAYQELAVLSCGVIIGRTTLYGSEAPSGVIVSIFCPCTETTLIISQAFLEHLFPTPQSFPSYIWYDNNCRVKRVLQNMPDHPLNQIGLPVDIFHFKSKHSKSDEFCGQHCNAAQWEELMDGNKWRFNSSAAEQANVWMVGFLPIVREMRVEYFNFYLDEVIRRRNEWIVQELANQSKYPRYLNRHILYGN
jgi:hypothetical protein